MFYVDPHTMQLQTPISANAIDMQTLGQISNRGGSLAVRGKRGRPISAFPVPGAQQLTYPGNVSESIDSTQASHMYRLSHSIAKNSHSRKNFVPHSVELVEKEKLFKETVSLKRQRNDVMLENAQLKTHMRAMELDMRKKDTTIVQLTQEIKKINIATTPTPQAPP